MREASMTCILLPYDLPLHTENTKEAVDDGLFQQAHKDYEEDIDFGTTT